MQSEPFNLQGRNLSPEHSKGLPLFAHLVSARARPRILNPGVSLVWWSSLSVLPTSASEISSCRCSQLLSVTVEAEAPCEPLPVFLLILRPVLTRCGRPLHSSTLTAQWPCAISLSPVLPALKLRDIIEGHSWICASNPVLWLTRCMHLLPRAVGWGVLWSTSFSTWPSPIDSRVLVAGPHAGHEVGQSG